MTDIAANSAWLVIEERLDAIGRKHRLIQTVRGFLMWVGFAVAASVGAAFAAHALRQGPMTVMVAILWGAWLVGSAAIWIGKPLLRRPNRAQVARLIESKIPDLHNGLTNSVLLSRALDIQASPFLAPIFQEILQTSQAKPLEEATKISDTANLAARLGILMAVGLTAAILFHGQFFHGWHQMFAPRAFVPQTGAMRILGVQPGDTTLVAGQPLEISVLAAGPESPEAKLIFDGSIPAASLTGTATDDGNLRYSYRLDHVDQPMRYRVEVGQTQSPWYTISTVRDVKLTEIDLIVTPPAYTHLSPSSLQVKTADLEKTPIIVPQGSKVQLTASLDVAVSSALLVTENGAGDAAPVAMNLDDPRRFSAAMNVAADMNASVNVMEGQQIIAKLPESGLFIHCKTDTPPTIVMNWPSQDDAAIPPTQNLHVQADITDDYGLTSASLWMGIGDADLKPVAEVPASAIANLTKFAMNLPIQLTPGQSASGQSIRVQVQAVDNRDLHGLLQDGGPQITRSPILTIKFLDPQAQSTQNRQDLDLLRQRLMDMLKAQQGLFDKTVAWKPEVAGVISTIGTGQTDLRNLMVDTADKFSFDANTMIVKRTLQVLAVNPAREAIDLAAMIAAEPLADQQGKLSLQLQDRQRSIISTLEALLADIRAADAPTTQPANGHEPLLSQADAFKKLQDALAKYEKEQQKILDQTAQLAKKPVDNFDADDKKKLADLQQQQDNLDAFMQQAISDFSKNAEQDMSNPSLVKDLTEMETQVTMAKDALNKQATEIAVPAEENGLELAKEITSNIEKWMSDSPNRTKWSQEDPLNNAEAPMPELPSQLEDMMGQLLEQQEDIFQQMEDDNANWHDSIDKGAGWGAADGPISDNSAKGVTGNVLPSNNEMQGRSAEGRNGQSQGEFVGDSAVGKGGRNTPTRLDPTPFQKGQINDTSKDPTGGATGGGKVSGAGAAGLEGPVPPQMQDMERLKTKQAELRNTAEKLLLNYKLSNYDNFKLQEAVTLMRRIEDDLDANRYQNALRERDVLVDLLSTSKNLVGGEVHVAQDTTPAPTGKMQQDIDSMKGQLPPAWSDALNEYYRKLAEQ